MSTRRNLPTIERPPLDPSTGASDDRRSEAPTVISRLVHDFGGVQIVLGTAQEYLRSLAPGIVQTVVTSPPYYRQRDYGVAGQLGLEGSPDAYVASLVATLEEVRRVLRDDGTLWINLGDSYAGPRRTCGIGAYSTINSTRAAEAFRLVPHSRSAKLPPGVKAKDLLGIPWSVALALRAAGWYLRQEIIWAKPNPKPESVRDRCTRAHEYLFLLSKSERYYFDADAISEPAIWPRGPGNVVPNRTIPGQRSGANANTSSNLHAIGPRAVRFRRSVWSIQTRPYRGAHFATFPPALVEPCLLAGSKPGDLVLDPFAGTGTTLEVARRLGRASLGIEISQASVDLIFRRLRLDQGTLDYRQEISP